MKEREMTDGVRKRLAERLRRLHYWGRFNPETPGMDELILSVIINRLWSIWGYPRLLDCLLDEFKLPPKQVMEWIKTAVGKGYEREDLYGNSTTRE